jgi:hypothetical protein
VSVRAILGLHRAGSVRVVSFIVLNVIGVMNRETER